MLKRILDRARSFKENQKGSLSVEAVIILPILFWAISASFTFFHAYKAQNASYRANYTISDILSRETNQINTAYMRGLQNVYQYMTFAKTADTWVRVSVVQCRVRCDQDDRDLEMLWSEGTNGARDLEASDVGHWAPKIPWLPKGDSLVLVETSMNYTPPFSNFLINFPERKLVSHSVTRPRFTPQILWEGMNSGNDSAAQNETKTDNHRNRKDKKNKP